MKHAVFATHVEDSYRSRVTRWLDWDAAIDEWTRLDNRRTAGELPHLKFVEVRSQDDPKYKDLPFRDWDALPVEERPQVVKLSRWERSQLLKIGRAAGNLEDAADAMFTELMHDSRWEHLEAITVSDYAWGAAHFCFPHQIGW